MSHIQTKDDFAKKVERIKRKSSYEDPFAWAIGLARYSWKFPDKLADVTFPVVNVGTNSSGSAAILSELFGRLDQGGSFELTQEALLKALEDLAPFEGDPIEQHPNLSLLHQVREEYQRSGHLRAQPALNGVFSIPRRVVVAFVPKDLDQPPVDAAETYLRLYLLSRRYVKPNGLNLKPIFNLLNPFMFTDDGPIDPEAWDDFVWRARFELGIEPGKPPVDKIPWLTSYLSPSGVRIAAPQCARLGAYLSPGTTIMPYGYVNYNAGTLPPPEGEEAKGVMVEGRIPQGVTVGDGTDIGGGASIKGTLSGGGKEIVSIGRFCMVGAMGGVSISLGDGCAVQYGCAFDDNEIITNVATGYPYKARELSGEPNMRIWRNSVTGRLEVKRDYTGRTPLNPALHH